MYLAAVLVSFSLLSFAQPKNSTIKSNTDFNSIQNNSNSSYNSTKNSFDVIPYKIDALLDSASLYSSKDPGKAYDFVEQALVSSISGKYLAGEIRSYRQLGIINYDLKVYDVAASNYQKAQALLSNTSLEQKYSDIFNLNGMSLREQGKNEDALNAFNKFLLISRSAGDSGNVIIAKSNIGSVFSSQKKYTEAMAQYEYVLNAEKKRNNKTGIISASQRIGGLLFLQSRLNESVLYYKQALELAKETGDAHLVSELTDDISEVYKQQKRSEDELNVRQYSQKYSESQNDISTSNGQNLKIADLYIQTNRTSDAINYLNNTANTIVPITESDKNDNSDLLQERSDAYKTLSEVYVKQGDYAKALDNYKNYMSVFDSLQRKKEKNEVVQKQVNDDLFRKQLKIDMLQKEKDLNEKTIELLRKDEQVHEQSMKNQRLLIYALVGGLLAVLFTALFVYRGSRQKKIASELLALQGLRSQMNPHFIFNALNSVNHYIAGNDERKANKYLSEFSKLMRSVMENSQKDFVPLTTEIEILELYLGLEHARFSDKFDYTFTVEPIIDSEQFMIPPMIIQPYIENAIWHGLRYREGKGTLNVSIVADKRGLRISIVDDGIGRAKSQELKTTNQMKTRSTGMHNTERRLKLINEIFNTNIIIMVSDANADGTGTKVEMRIPAAASHGSKLS